MTVTLVNACVRSPNTGVSLPVGVDLAATAAARRRRERHDAHVAIVDPREEVDGEAGHVDVQQRIVDDGAPLIVDLEGALAERERRRLRRHERDVHRRVADVHDVLQRRDDEADGLRREQRHRRRADVQAERARVERRPAERVEVRLVHADAEVIRRRLVGQHVGVEGLRLRDRRHRPAAPPRARTRCADRRARRRAGRATGRCRRPRSRRRPRGCPCPPTAPARTTPASRRRPSAPRCRATARRSCRRPPCTRRWCRRWRSSCSRPWSCTARTPACRSRFWICVATCVCSVETMMPLATALVKEHRIPPESVTSPSGIVMSVLAAESPVVFVVLSTAKVEVAGGVHRAGAGVDGDAGRCR